MKKIWKMALYTLLAVGATACNSSDSEGGWPVPEAPIEEMRYTPELTQFALWAPTAEEVEVRIYADNTLEQTLTMRPAESCMWEAELPGDQAGKQYTFRVKVAGVVYYCCFSSMRCPSRKQTRIPPQHRVRASRV